MYELRSARPGPDLRRSGPVASLRSVQGAVPLAPLKRLSPHICKVICGKKSGICTTACEEISMKKIVMSKDISEMLKTLVESYDFNKNTLSKYLGISGEQIEGIAQGNTDCLPKEFAARNQILAKIGLLYFSPIQDEDLKLRGFLEVLILYHNLSKGTIAKMAGVEVSEIEKLLSNPPAKVEIETKYKIATNIMALRLFLKDCEPPIGS